MPAGARSCVADAIHKDEVLEIQPCVAAYFRVASAAGEGSSAAANGNASAQKAQKPLSSASKKRPASGGRVPAGTLVYSGGSHCSTVKFLSIS